MEEQEREPCGICGEPLRMDDYRQDIAEMFDPKQPYKDAVICHAQCGIDKGLVIA